MGSPRGGPRSHQHANLVLHRDFVPEELTREDFVFEDADGAVVANPLEELMVVALDDHDTFNPASLSGTLFEAAISADPGSEERGARVDYGTIPVSGWPNSNPKTVGSRVGSFDLAGNVSGWSAPTNIDLPPIPDNCAVTAPGVGGSGRSLMAIGMMMLGLTFRWRVQRARSKASHDASSS